MITQEAEILFESGGRWPQACVVISLYNYQQYIVEALESVKRQSLRDIALLIVDDKSRDDSANIVNRWLDSNKDRFAKTLLVRNLQNAGLSITRNTGARYCESEYIFFLDADNMLYPKCLERHVEALEFHKDAQAAYGLIEIFGADSGLMGTEVFNRERLAFGNYVDAMAMIRRKFFIASGGYRDFDRLGWEDYDLWLRMCEASDYAVHIPEILSRYRVHRSSMLRTITNRNKNMKKIKKLVTHQHPWLRL